MIKDFVLGKNKKEVKKEASEKRRQWRIAHFSSLSDGKPFFTFSYWFPHKNTTQSCNLLWFCILTDFSDPQTRIRTKLHTFLATNHNWVFGYG